MPVDVPVQGPVSTPVGLSSTPNTAAAPFAPAVVFVPGHVVESADKFAPPEHVAESLDESTPAGGPPRVTPAANVTGDLNRS